jgi:hypothetical protein
MPAGGCRSGRLSSMRSKRTRKRSDDMIAKVNWADLAGAAPFLKSCRDFSGPHPRRYLKALFEGDWECCSSCHPAPANGIARTLCALWRCPTMGFCNSDTISPSFTTSLSRMQGPVVCRTPMHSSAMLGLGRKVAQPISFLAVLREWRTRKLLVHRLLFDLK